VCFVIQPRSGDKMWPCSSAYGKSGINHPRPNGARRAEP
jgi:hypothetical protein